MSSALGWVTSLMGLLVSEVLLSTLYRFVKASEAVDRPQRCANRVWGSQFPPKTSTGRNLVRRGHWWPPISLSGLLSSPS